MLEKLIEKINPPYIGMSVMSCLYMETVKRVSERIKNKFSIPIIWGGVYATLMSDDLLTYCDYVIRGEGEGALLEFLDHRQRGLDTDAIKNLVVKKSDKIIKNDVREYIQDLDALGYLEIGDRNIYLIENNTVFDRLCENVSLQRSLL